MVMWGERNGCVFLCTPEALSDVLLSKMFLARATLVYSSSLLYTIKLIYYQTAFFFFFFFIFSCSIFKIN